MRRLSRLDGPIHTLRSRLVSSQSSSFLCSACRSRASFSTANRFAQPILTTEKIRKKIWGTSNPPGLKDPYEGPSITNKELERDAKGPKDDAEEQPQEEMEIKPSRTPRPNFDASYEPAKTWDGLEEVGELPVPEFYFKGYLPSTAVTDRYEATVALHRAVVEVFTMLKAGRSLSELANVSTKTDKTSDVQIKLPTSNPSAPVLEFSEAVPEAAVLETLSQAYAEGPEESEEDFHSAENHEESSIMESTTAGKLPAENAQTEAIEALGRKHKGQVASWDPIWLLVSLDDPEIKFAVVKRVMQLTGIRIPDSALNSIYTARSLLAHITRKPKPAKLFDELARKSNLVNLPNVKIFDRRITPIDREKMVGRWKLIEKELSSRGLPVTGH